MSKGLQEQIDKLFDATKEMYTFEEIKPHCEQFKKLALICGVSDFTNDTKLDSN